MQAMMQWYLVLDHLEEQGNLEMGLLASVLSLFSAPRYVEGGLAQYWRRDLLSLIDWYNDDYMYDSQGRLPKPLLLAGGSVQAWVD